MSNDYDLSYNFTIKSVSIYMNKKIDILDFAKHHYGCVIRNVGKFRCTYYDDNITMNMYNSGSFIVFTYTLTDEELKEHIYKIFGCYYREAKLSNMSIRFNFPTTNNIVFSEVERRLICRSVEDMFMKKSHEDNDECVIEDGMTKCYVHNYRLATDKFPGLRIKVWENKKIKIIIFATGKINCMGIKNYQDIDIVKKYLANALFPMLEECKVSDEDLNINFDDLL